MEIALLVIGVIGLGVAGIQTHYTRRQTRLAEEAVKEAERLKRDLDSLKDAVSEQKWRADQAEAKVAAVEEAVKGDQALVRLVSEAEMKRELKKGTRFDLSKRGRRDSGDIFDNHSVHRTSIPTPLRGRQFPIIQGSLWVLMILGIMEVIFGEGKSLWDFVRSLFGQ